MIRAFYLDARQQPAKSQSTFCRGETVPQCSPHCGYHLMIPCRPHEGVPERAPGPRGSKPRDHLCLSQHLERATFEFMATANDRMIQTAAFLMNSADSVTRIRNLSIASVISGYGIALASLTVVRPLWLDEIIQLMGVRGQTVEGTVAYLLHQPGSAPLGYLLQSVFVNSLGYSLFSIRVSSVIAAAGVLFIIAAITARWGYRVQAFTMLVCMGLPLFVRYALEGRPYSSAMFWSALATFLVLQMDERSSFWQMLLYVVALTAGVYFQPFSLFVAAGHISWAFFRRSPMLIPLLGAATFAAATFAPWYLYARPGWGVVIQQLGDTGQSFHFNWRTPLMLFREISGASYWGSALLLITVMLGLRSPSWSSRQKSLMWATAVSTIVCPLIADALSGYFVAVRQIIFSLPAIAVMAGHGFEWAWQNGRVRSRILLTSFVAVSLGYIVVWLNRPQEDWQRAAATMTDATSSACLLTVPNDILPVYAFFEPDLSRRSCNESESRELVLVRSPYATAEEHHSVLAAIASRGYVRRSEEVVGGSVISRFATSDVKSRGNTSGEHQ